MNQQERRIFLIREMLSEQPRYAYIEIPENEQEQKRLLRSLFNIRMPGLLFCNEIVIKKQNKWQKQTSAESWEM